MDPETINYLKLKGVFDLPNKEVIEMMMLTYFSHVHPFFPVIEAKALIEEFEQSRQDLSIHLLWSIFLAAANVGIPFVGYSDVLINFTQFADDTTLRAAGFATRKEMKRSMYSKAKVKNSSQ